MGGDWDNERWEVIEPTKMGLHLDKHMGSDIYIDRCLVTETEDKSVVTDTKKYQW